MSRKTVEAYDSIFQTFTKNVPRTDNIKVFMSDFEAAIRKCAAQLFPLARIAGCNIHYDRVSPFFFTFFFY